MTIIALSGKSRSGKDSMADVLVKKHNFTRIALADPLRELCSKVFYMHFSEFNDQDKKDERIQRIHLDFHHIDKIRNIVEFEWGYTIPYDDRERMEEFHGAELDTPRDIMRVVGTKLLRDFVDPDIWVNLALAKIRETGGNVVITDCRFQNERDTFGNLGALLVLIRRGDKDMKEHEFSLGKEDDYDVVFDNNGTLNEFQSNVNTWYTVKQDELHYYQVFKYE